MMHIWKESEKKDSNMKNRNILRCVLCGKEILTEAGKRTCSWCGSPMEFIGKENDENK